MEQDSATVGQKRDIYFQGKIYVGCEQSIPVRTDQTGKWIAWNLYLSTLKSYEVAGNHNWVDGQCVDKLYARQEQRLRYGSDEWVNCGSEELYVVEAGRKRIVAIPLPTIQEQDIEKRAEEYADKETIDYEIEHPFPSDVSIHQRGVLMDIFKKQCIKNFIAGATSTHKALVEAGGDMPDELLKYLNESFKEAASIYGNVKKISCYGGSAFVIFEDGECYRLNWQSYDQNTVTMD